jgi:hypothetical protein
MKVLSLILLIGLLGCGVSPRQLNSASPNTSQVTVSGFVSTIQLTTAATSVGSNSLTTAVTLIPQFPPNVPTTTLVFCGNVVAEFFLNTFTTVIFAPGLDCLTIVSLVPTSFVEITGFVSIIQVTLFPDGTVATTVTFLLPFPQNGLAETVTFCGDVDDAFALDAFMTVDLAQLDGCAELISAGFA